MSEEDSGHVPRSRGGRNGGYHPGRRARPDGKRDESPTASRILAVLHEQLQ